MMSGPSQSRGRRSPQSHDGEQSERVNRLVEEGAHLLSQHRPGEALAPLLKAHELDPDNVVAAINIGSAYILQGRHKQAIPILEKASQLEPTNSMVWINLAAAYLGKLPFSTIEMQNQAIKAFEQALTLDARAPHVNYNLGLIYLERKDVEQAALHFYAAIENDPNDRDAQMWLDKIRRGLS